MDRRDFLALGHERFEQLVGSLVRRAHAGATFPHAPDHGADVLVPACDATPCLVWQVKYFEGNDPPWAKAVESLTQAIAHYQPREVTFVFSRDLTAAERRRARGAAIVLHRELTRRALLLERMEADTSMRRPASPPLTLDLPPEEERTLAAWTSDKAWAHVSEAAALLDHIKWDCQPGETIRLVDQMQV